MLAYVDQARLPHSRRNRAQELAFWLGLGSTGARHWLAGRAADSQDYLGWLQQDAVAAVPPRSSTSTERKVSDRGLAGHAAMLIRDL